MKIVNGVTYFDKNNKKLKQYKYLDNNIKCDILIIGGGIEGAVLNYYLSKEYNVVLVDAGRIGRSSTSIATALLEFQLDDFAEDLKSLMQEEEIVQVYKMGLASIDKMNALIKDIGNRCKFKLKSSFLYSNKKSDIKKLEQEYAFRKKHGFDCVFYDENTNPFEFDIKAGIFDKNGGAEINPYLFTKQLIESSKNQSQLFENTKITEVINKQNYVECQTEYGNRIRAKYVILATGFCFDLLEDYVKNLMTVNVSYSIVAKSKNKINLYDNALVQDCLTNYHYLRLLDNHTVIFGGEDTPFCNKIDEKLAETKYISLYKNLSIMFESNTFIKTHEFCGIFATTDNNLGIIGQGKSKNIIYFISCGANGIINTFFGIDIVFDILKNRENKLASLFSPLRQS